MPKNTNDHDATDLAPVTHPFNLATIHGELLEIREILAQIVSGGEPRSSTRAVVALDKVDNLGIRIAVERSLGNVAR